MEITVSNRQTTLVIDEAAVQAAVRNVLQDTSLVDGSVNVAIVDDPTIHELNRRFLDHDWPTDVLSFALEQTDDELQGEIVVSADTARQQAADYGWSPTEELLLYVVHGALHLAGYGDKSAAQAERMRAAESHYLATLGITRGEDRTAREAHGSTPRDVSQFGGSRRP